MISREDSRTSVAYLVKKNPVNVRAVYCGSEIVSVGRSSSRNDAPEINHLLIGAQKCTVNGPAGDVAKAPKAVPLSADFSRAFDPTSAVTIVPVRPALAASAATSLFSPISSLWLMARYSCQLWAATFVMWHAASARFFGWMARAHHANRDEYTIITGVIVRLMTSGPWNCES